MSTALAKPEPKKKRPPRISRLVRDAVDLLVRGEVKSIQHAAECLSCSREHLSRSLNKDHVQEYLAAQSRRHVNRAVCRAAAVKVELLEAESENVRNQASTEILAIGGISAAREGANITASVNVQVGYVIRLDGTMPAAPVVDITPSSDTSAT